MHKTVFELSLCFYWQRNDTQNILKKSCLPILFDLHHLEEKPGKGEDKVNLNSKARGKEDDCCQHFIIQTNNKYNHLITHFPDTY